MSKELNTASEEDIKNLNDAACTNNTNNAESISEEAREYVKAEREARKALKAAKKSGGDVDGIMRTLDNLKLKLSSAAAEPKEIEKKKPALTKAERRAKQEAERAAKATKTVKDKKSEIVPAEAIVANKKPVSILTTAKNNSTVQNKSVLFVATSEIHPICAKLFCHLEFALKNPRIGNDTRLHPCMARLGLQYSQRTIVGSNARCIAFLNALSKFIDDFRTPEDKIFAHSIGGSLKHSVEYLHKCRPLSVSIDNAYRHFKYQLSLLPPEAEDDKNRSTLKQFVEQYLENHIHKAAISISALAVQKIENGDVLLTFACSSLIEFVLTEAKRSGIDFRVIIADARPFHEGQEMLRRLQEKGIACTYVLVNAVSYVMPTVKKVLLGAHAVMLNGSVMSRAGTAQVALVARAHNVPVLVCCETHKFSDRLQTDAIVQNELGDPEELVRNDKCCLKGWESKTRLILLNLMYDITPPELITAVVNEVAILPSTSAPVILRMKPELLC